MDLSARRLRALAGRKHDGGTAGWLSCPPSARRIAPAARVRAPRRTHRGGRELRPICLFRMEALMLRVRLSATVSILLISLSVAALLISLSVAAGDEPAPKQRQADYVEFSRLIHKIAA